MYDKTIFYNYSLICKYDMQIRQLQQHDKDVFYSIVAYFYVSGKHIHSNGYFQSNSKVSSAIYLVVLLGFFCKSEIQI